MKQLIAVVLESDVDTVTRALLDAGLMHFVNLQTLAGDKGSQLKPLSRSDTSRSVDETLTRIEELLLTIPFNPREELALDIQKLSVVDPEKGRNTVNTILEELKGFHTQISLNEEELKRLSDIRSQVQLFGNLKPTGSSQYSYLQMQTGTVSEENAENLFSEVSSLPAVSLDVGTSPGLRQIFLISMKKDEKKLDGILDRYEWQEVKLEDDPQEVGEKAAADLDSRIQALKESSAEVNLAIHDAVSSKRVILVDLWSNLRMNQLYGRIQSFFSRTTRTILFSGWVPANKEKELTSIIRSSCASDCFLEWQNAPSGSDESVSEVPVQLKNPGFLKPFEMLVNNYAVPTYGSIDPTPFVSVAYLVMFGLMFGDAGHGLVLLLAGLIGKRMYKKENNIKQLLTLLCYCGVSGIIAGVLFGSYFGFQIIKPLWFDFHSIVSGHSGGELVSSIYDVLAISIYFGIAVIGMGLILNWINLIKKQHWFDLFYNKAGIIGGFIYAAGIWATRYFIAHNYKELPDSRLLFLLIGIPVLLLAFKAPLKHIVDSRNGKNEKLHLLSFVDFFMEWIVELLEIFSGYLANTLSFMRIAGLGIAHEALLIAFFQIAGMASKNSLARPGPIIILVIGNVLIIGLEGLSAGIQSLRLNYYEFFSKYFVGSGRAYNPVSLRSTPKGDKV
jgi:V/A-type H+/Na+-transporting ATPase subunit I